jgi:hypothetical protein
MLKKSASIVLDSSKILNVPLRERFRLRFACGLAAGHFEHLVPCSQFRCTDQKLSGQAAERTKKETTNNQTV